MPNDQPPTYHPPPYGTETHDPAAPSPSYELDDLGAPPPNTRPHPHPLSLPATSSSPSIQSALDLDEATIEGCAPKKPPRKTLIPPWLFHTRRGKGIVAVVLLLLAGLVGAMIWYGVDGSKPKPWERKIQVNSYLDVARSAVEPEVASGLGYYDYELIAPFNFSSPRPSQILFDNRNYTIFTSTLQQALHIDLASFIYVNVFGSRSSRVTFVPAAEDDPELDMFVNVTGIWRGVDGWSEQDSISWGKEELEMVSGGLHGSPVTGGTRGVALVTSSSNVSDGSYQPSDLVTPFDFLPDWNNTLVFDVTVTVPRSFNSYTLSVFGESATSVDFGDFTQTNASFDIVDVRVPKGSISSSGGFNTSTSLSLFSLLPIVGQYTVTRSSLFISNSTIESKLIVLPIPSFPTYNDTSPATHNLTFLQRDSLSSSLLRSNITSFPAHANLTLTALNLNGTVEIHLPRDIYEGSVELGTQSGRIVSSFVSWANSTAYPRTPYALSFDNQYEHPSDASGTNWSEGEVVWRGEGGTDVGVGKGEIVAMSGGGQILVGAATTFYGER
ncbi:hypothetical protein BDY24DRAFT_435732 [Mrakia frigida]|uniref:uncharacterized protein n=1 Tax=Mrakia frigida TaxID=29902 RepID=UPI003FCC2186